MLLVLLIESCLKEYFILFYFKTIMTYINIYNVSGDLNKLNS